MISEIISWIDKKINEVSNTMLFQKYFSGEEISIDDKDFYLANKDEGIDIVMSNEFVINTIHLFSGKYMNVKSFKGELPFKIKFSFDRNDTYSLFGKPSKTGGGHNSIYVGYVPFWDKYYFQNYSLHFKFSNDNNSIDMLTISSLQLEEYFNSPLQ